MGINKKDDLELDFNGLRTENYSSTIPYLKNLTMDAKTLLERLPANDVQIGLFQDSENYDMYRMFEENPGNTNENNFSETSPFISSDVYNNLVRNQRGGGISSTSSSAITTTTTDSSSDMMRGGGKTESTSSSSSSSSSDHKKSEHKKHKKHNRDKSSEKSSEKSSDRSEDLEEEITEKMLSHSGRATTTASETVNDTNSYFSSSIKHQSDSEILSTISLNHKGRHNYTESINTSDINIVSVDD